MAAQLVAVAPIPTLPVEKSTVSGSIDRLGVTLQAALLPKRAELAASSAPAVPGYAPDP